MSAKNLASLTGLRKAIAPLYVSEAASTAITGATETAANFDTSATIPASYLSAGDVIRIKAQGIYTATTSTEDHTLALKLGTTSVFTSGALDPANDGMFSIECDIVIRTAGGSGTFVAVGEFVGVGASLSATDVHFFKASTAVDTTGSLAVAVAIDRQASATDGDSARLDILIVEVLKAA